MTQDMNQGGAAPPEKPMVTTTGGGGAQGEFPIGDMITEAWEIFKVNAGILIGGIFIIYIILIGANFFTMGLASIVLQGPLLLGYYIVVLKLIRKQPVEFGNIFDGFKQFLPAFLANLLVTIFTAIGMVFCIIPGLLVALVYCLVWFYLYDKQLDFWPAMEASRKKVMANLGSWVLLGLTVIALNIVGAIACFVGLFVSGPVSLLLLGLAYQRVEGGGGRAV